MAGPGDLEFGFLENRLIGYPMPEVHRLDRCPTSFYARGGCTQAVALQEPRKAWGRGLKDEDVGSGVKSSQQ